MKIGIGHSIEKDAAKAAREAARQAKKAVPEPDLALAFGSIEHDQKALHAALCEEIDPEILIGGSSYAEASPLGVVKGSVAVKLSGAKKRRITVKGKKKAVTAFECSP